MPQPIAVNHSAIDIVTAGGASAWASRTRVSMGDNGPPPSAPDRSGRPPFPVVVQAPGSGSTHRVIRLRGAPYIGMLVGT
ncbi:hypothetical protein GCM10009836_71570 [Pseudonocardia ailaonensis]|uniref:Uncharacterized protein n=1 Tax=Pseudonocardia ailaonensis TaxID=367279 RepID=A0ABN2NQB3_9PSEU